jgi:hypothetical protein
LKDTSGRFYQTVHVDGFDRTVAWCGRHSVQPVVARS